MKTLNQLKSLQKIHNYIKKENTGSPKYFAKKLNISERKLYNLLNHLKDLEAPLQFDRKGNSYYYSKHFDLLVNISVKVIIGDELKIIYGGNVILKDFLHTARLTF